MCWFKATAIVAAALLLAGCKPDIKETSGARYFDLKGFFTAEASRLNRLHNTVVKTATHNGVTQTKKVHITNWDRELDLFINSDINRPAWKNSYTITNSGDFIIYRAKYPELKMHQMLIKKEKGNVKWILIFNSAKNMLYQTSEKLSYFPDSLYIIDKDQHVRLMGNNNYKIKGVIN